MSEPTPENNVMPPAPRRGGAGLLWLMWLLLTAAVAAGGWWGWQQLQALQTGNSEQAQRLQTLSGQIQTLHTEQSEKMQTLREELDQAQAELAARRSAFQELRSGGQTSWLLNEAEALASLAQQRLALTADVAAARRLLEAADKVMMRLDIAEAISVRKALATDLETLRAAEKVDSTGLVLRLSALRESVSSLAVPAGAAPAPTSQAADGAEATGWRAMLADLVSVRRTERSLPLPLDAQQASLVRLHLLNSLQTAQLAVLQSRPALYDKALADAQAVLDSWFDAGDPAVSQLNDSLQSLRAAPVKQALPDIGAGLEALRAVIAQRERDA
jgi:uroporphyrin-3 C-methyltransferase